MKKVFLQISQNSRENTCARVSFLIKALAQAFSSEFCETFKSNFFTEHLRTTASQCRKENVCNGAYQYISDIRRSEVNLKTY